MEEKVMFSMVEGNANSGISNFFWFFLQKLLSYKNTLYKKGLKEEKQD